MKPEYLFLSIFLLFFSLSCNQESSSTNTSNNSKNEVEQEPEKKPLSPQTSTAARIDNVYVKIEYSSPSVRGRAIWGGLVAYDKVWVTGANKATSISFNNDVKINGQVISADTYAFFTIPGKEEWILILNKNYNQHLADDYDESLDVIRFKAIPEELPEAIESLKYEITQVNERQGAISVMWDRLKVGFEFETF